MIMRQTPSGSCPPPERIELVRTGEGTAADTAHIEGCAECRELLRDLESLAGTLRAGRSQPKPPPAEVEMSIFEAYRETMAAKAATDKSAKVARPSWKRWAMPLAAAAGVALFAVMVQLEQPTQYYQPELRQESAAPPAPSIVTAEADRADKGAEVGRLAKDQAAKPDAVAVAEPEARLESKTVAKAKKAPAVPVSVQSADREEGVAYRSAQAPAASPPADAPMKRERANVAGSTGAAQPMVAAAPKKNVAAKSFADDFAPRELSEAAVTAAEPAGVDEFKEQNAAPLHRVNVLDAFRLALALEQGQTDPSLDHNGDGRVDRGDVDFLAQAAVRLGEG